MDKETHKKLIKDFDKKDVRPAPKGKFGEYVPHHLYTKRLVEVIGGKYNFTFDEIRGKDNAIVGAKGRLEIEGLGVVEEVGDVSKYQLENNTESEVLKLAVSDSIKRCCMRFGLGLHLWVGESTEEEHYAEEETKKVIKQLDNSSKEIVKETTKEDYLTRITNELQHAEEDSELRGKYKLEAWNLFKQTNETDMGKWTSFELDNFLDLFYQAQAQDKNKIVVEEPSDKEIVEDVFGEVKSHAKVCPQCKKTDNIEDNRQKKADNSTKFGGIPDFTCTNWNNAGGCGWGGYIGSKGEKEVPSTWL
tara:strand:+ start:5866 stop:6777 length:912 start_codon:yes stop_codon:yes gene_type:complete